MYFHLDFITKAKDNFFFKKIYLFIFLVPCGLWVLILVPSRGIEPGPPALEA